MKKTSQCGTYAKRFCSHMPENSNPIHSTSHHAKMLELLIENAREYAIVMTDSEGRIVLWNTGAENVFLYDANGSTTSILALGAIVGPQTQITTYTWDAANRLASTVLPSGAVYKETYRFDDLCIEGG